MKKFLLLLSMGVLLTAGSVRAADEIAFIDMQEVFKQFYKTQLAQDQIRQQADDLKLERDELETEIAGMKDEVEVLRKDARNETLSEEVRASKRDLLEEKLVALQKKEQEMNDFEKLRLQQMDQQNARMTKKLYDEIHEAVINYAKAQGFISVIDRSAQSRIGTDVVLFVSPKADITANVITVLNEGREGTRTESNEFMIEN